MISPPLYLLTFHLVSSLSYKMDSSEKMNSIDPYMDPVLYKAAEEGNIDPFENYQTYPNHLLNPDENTILHVYLKNQSRMRMSHFLRRGKR